MTPPPTALGDGIVKICGLRRPEHAVAAVEAGADLLGFMFAPSKRRVTLEEAAACVTLARRVVDRSFLAVGVFVDGADEDIDRAVDVAGLDLVQIHGDRAVSSAGASGRAVIRPIRVKPGMSHDDVIAQVNRDREQASPPVAWMIDGYDPVLHGGTGVRADWSLAASVAEVAPLFLAGGLTPENVSEAIGRVRPMGVDVSSGVERVGEKDPVLIQAFVRAARQAFASR